MYFGNIQDVRVLNMETDEQEINKLATKLNLPIDALTSGKYVKIFTDKGTDVIDVEKIMGATGMLDQLEKEEFDKSQILFKNRLDEAKSTTTDGKLPTTIQNSQYISALEAVIVDPKSTPAEVTQAKSELASMKSQITNSAEVSNTLKTEAAALVVEGYTFQDILDGKKPTKDQRIAMAKKDKASGAEIEAIAAKVSLVNKLDKGISQLSAVDSEQVGLGLGSLKEELDKYMTPAKLANMSDEEVSAEFAKLLSVGTLGDVLASYIKSISGAAASDLERAFLTTVMTGGSYTSKEARLASLKNFQTNMNKATQTHLSLLYEKNPSLVANAMGSMDSAINPKVSTDVKALKNKYKKAK
jgi:hypothetical protein